MLLFQESLMDKANGLITLRMRYLSLAGPSQYALKGSFLSDMMYKNFLTL